MYTPWGYSQQEYKITDGVYIVMTAGHGGVVMTKPKAEELLSKEAIAKGWEWVRGFLAYEEDCDWAIVAFEQPELYAAAWSKAAGRPVSAEEIKQVARESLERWHKDYLAKVDATPTQADLIVE